MSNSYMRFWGVRGSCATPSPDHLKVGGNTSCVEINVDDKILVCDAGTGIVPFGNKVLKDPKVDELLIILTHYHWDHICGLPFFVPAFLPNKKIKFYGPGQNSDEIKKILGKQMKEPYFPVGIESWMANIEYIDPLISKLEYGPYSIEHYNVHHPGNTYGYIIHIPSKNKKIIYISDNEFLFLSKTVKERSSELNEEEIAAYTEMSRVDAQNEIDYLRDADILIHDAQYTKEQYAQKKGWGHSCYEDTVNNAIEANVKHLYLYHHDPYNDDESIEKIYEHSQQIIQQRQSSLKCDVAREGMIVDL